MGGDKSSGKRIKHSSGTKPPVAAGGARSNLLRSLKSCVVLFLLGAWAVFTPLAEAQQTTLTGWFTFIVADYPSETGLVSETTYFLTEDSGARHELLIDVELMRPLGGPVALNRKRVTVEGEWEQSGPDAPARFRVSPAGRGRSGSVWPVLGRKAVSAVWGVWAFWGVPEPSAGVSGR